MGGEGRLRRGRLKRELAVEEGLRHSEQGPNLGHKYTSTALRVTDKELQCIPQRIIWIFCRENYI